MNDAQNRNRIRPDPNGPVGSVIRDLRERADRWASLGVQVDGAEISRRDAETFERAFCDFLTEPMTIREAAAFSGYSPDHLRDLVRQGKLPEVAREQPKQGAAIKIPRHCLPRKCLSERSRSAGSATDSENCEAEANDPPRGRTPVERALDSVTTGSEF